MVTQSIGVIGTLIVRIMGPGVWVLQDVLIICYALTVLDAHVDRIMIVRSCIKGGNKDDRSI